MKGFETFFFNCAADPKFSKEYLIPEIQRQGLISTCSTATWCIRSPSASCATGCWPEGALRLGIRQQPWGARAVDTFNSAKVIFNFPMDHLPPDEFDAPADFPSIWLQRPRREPRPMELHWDGNNTDMTERNKSAAFGTGTTPPTSTRIRRWRSGSEAEPPPFTRLFPSTRPRGAARPSTRNIAPNATAPPGGISAAIKGGSRRWPQIGTDRRRLDSTPTPWRSIRPRSTPATRGASPSFRKTHGYANMPLDGIWLRAPYLHNGSVPSLRDLLDRRPRRPAVFWRGKRRVRPGEGRLRVEPARGRRKKPLLPLRHHPAGQRQRGPRGPGPTAPNPGRRQGRPGRIPQNFLSGSTP